MRREPEPARVVVEQLGFTQGSASRGARHVAYGLEVVNRSYDQDALGIDVAVSCLGADGRLLARESLRLTGLPAATTFYVGGRTRAAPQADVERFAVTVAVRSSRKSGLVLPVAADVSLGRDRRGRLRVTGMLTNAGTRRLTSAARVYAVIFDGRGTIIGGGVTSITSGLPAGQTVAFAVDELSPTPARQALFAGVSIDP